MALRETVTHFGGASAALQPNGVYIGTITAVLPNRRAKVRITALGIAVGPCRSIDGVTLEKGGQVLCSFLNGRLGEMVIIGGVSGLDNTVSEGPKVIPDSTYTLSGDDQNSLLRFTSNSDVTLTIPASSSVSFAADAVIDIIQYGSGVVTVVGDTGVVVQSPALLRTRTQFSLASIIKVDTDEWALIGDLAVF